MMSVRPKTFAYTARERKAGLPLDIEVPDPSDPGIHLLERRAKEEARDIRESDVLVSGGGGALRCFPLLGDLAEEFGGMVCASRRAVDSGAAPREIQVGHSGKNVGPRLYLALGISGSAQHVAGLKDAECIISVNTDCDAPICGISDIVVEGDVRQFVEGLTTRIRAARGKQTDAAGKENRQQIKE
jgi:electron transfer flavoprotein alpha subunit